MIDSGPQRRPRRYSRPAAERDRSDGELEEQIEQRGTAMGGQTETRARPLLRQELGVTAFFTLALGTMIGVGWVVVMHDWLERGGPGGAILAFVLAGALFVPIAVVYGRLTASVPFADGEMAYTASLFPRNVR